VIGIRSAKTKHGFTLIELLLVLVIMAIIVPVTVVGLRTMLLQANRAEKLTVATDLARYYMELALSKRFDEVMWDPETGPPPPAWTANGDLGVDNGFGGNPPNINGPDNEVPTILLTFDDVDDFHNFSLAAIPDFPDYSLLVTVQYLEVDTLGGANDGLWGRNTVIGPTNAKLITVQVTHSMIGTVTLNAATGARY